MNVSHSEETIKHGQIQPIIPLTTSGESSNFSSDDSEHEAADIGNEGSSKLSSSDSYISSDDSEEDEGLTKKKQKLYNSGTKLPNGFLDPLPPLPDDEPARNSNFEHRSPLDIVTHSSPSSKRNAEDGNDAGEAVRCTDREKTGYCFPCIGKWVSDISELDSLSISDLVSYLRTEFQSMHFERVEEKLRVLEEEHMKFKDVMKHVQDLEEELMVYKDMANGTCSSKEKIIENTCSCDERVLEGLAAELRCKVSGGGGWQCKRWRLQDSRYCERHYFMLASRTGKWKDKVKKEVKGKKKTKKVAEIKQRGSPTHSKRLRESEHVSDEVGGKIKKRNHEGLYQKVVLKAKNAAVEEAVKVRSEILEKSEKPQKKKSITYGQSFEAHAIDRHASMPLLKRNTEDKKWKGKVDVPYMSGLGESGNMLCSPQKQLDDPSSFRKRGKWELEVESDSLTMLNSAKGLMDVDPEIN